MKVAVVDDSKEVTNLLVDMLESNGLEARAINDATKAISELITNPAEIVILDIMMPGIDGITLCKTIKTNKKLGNVKVIMYTCKDFIEDREKAAKVGADGFINKSTGPHEIMNIINELISSRMYIKFWGTRGSLPTPDSDMMGFGGETSCVEMGIGNNLLIFDAGTGIRKLGDYLQNNGKNIDNLALFLSHFHWDHTQGFPFFMPVYDKKMKINLYGCREAGIDVYKILETQMGFPYFPIPLRYVSANLAFFPITEGDFKVKDIDIKTIYVNHPGNALGFRVEWKGKVVIYIPDNELSPGAFVEKTEFNEKLINFCKNADVLIHDAQYTPKEYETKKSWGHTPFTEAIDLAIKAEVKKFYMFHHDPSHTDAKINEMLQECRKTMGSKHGLVCEAAKQGQRIDL